MKHPNNTVPVLPELPEGFSLRPYQKGDENDWADIQVAVTEFPDRAEALKCYDLYWQHMDELIKRQLFIIDDAVGKAVSTATAWYMDKDGQRIGVVHGFSCLPQYQSKGLGRIAAAYMMERYHRLMPGCPVWLDTQTWSYKAVGIYMDLGFIPMKKAVYNDVPNEFDEAVNTLRGVMREDKFKQFLRLAE
jgi:GNAT superfamily N-acetyltransferase